MSFLEDHLLPEEQLSQTHVQPAFPATSQDKPLCTEGTLDLKTDHVKDKELVAKTSEIDDSLMVKKSIERGESIPKIDNVRN